LFFNNRLYHHQHRGIQTIGPLFSSTSGDAGYRKYFLHLFSITSRDIPSFLIYPVFSLPWNGEFINLFNFNDIDFIKISIFHH